LSVAAEAAECTLCFSAAEPFFAGHFPDRPLVPGLVLVDCLVSLAQTWLQETRPMRTLSEAKFRAEVLPGAVLNCRVERAGDDILARVCLNERVAVEATFSF
jgi:3-hydroxyacyl-[acyl-carrier-protein] dehydratase